MAAQHPHPHHNFMRYQDIAENLKQYRKIQEQVEQIKHFTTLFERSIHEVLLLDEDGIPFYASVNDPKAIAIKIIDHVEQVNMYPMAATGTSDIRIGRYQAEEVALKSSRFYYKYDQCPSFLRAFGNELGIWSSLTHEHIHPCLGIHFYNNMSKPIPTMVSKFLPNGNLATYVTSHPEIDKEEMLAGVASALAYMHSKTPAILHGDIRAMNILIGPDGKPLLIDFDCSVIMDPLGGMENSENLHRGTLRWMAPEKLRASSSQVTLKSDVYSFGCLGVELFSGRRPFDYLPTDGSVIIEVMVREGRPSRPQTEELSDELWELLDSCMLHDPSARPTMQEIHEFFSKLRVTDSTSTQAL